MKFPIEVITPEHFDDDDVIIYNHNVTVANKNDVYL